MDFGLKNIIEYRGSCSGIAADALPSITELPRRQLPDSEKEMVIAYLKNDSFTQWRNFGKPLTDAFTEQDIPAWGYVLTDGEYTWIDDLAIYVERYDIELPRSFVEHVKHQAGRISGSPGNILREEAMTFKNYTKKTLAETSEWKALQEYLVEHDVPQEKIDSCLRYATIIADEFYGMRPRINSNGAIISGGRTAWACPAGESPTRCFNKIEKHAELQ